MTSVKEIKRYVVFFIGVLITAISFNVFFLPFDLVVYDVSGLTIILKHFFMKDPLIIMTIFSMGCLLLGFIFLGFKDTKNAILGSFLYPILVKLTENIGSIITFDKPDMLVIAIFAGITTGFGTGLIFKSGFNTGGTDIIELITTKYLKMPFSKSMLIIDGSVVVAGGIVFGYEILLYALIALTLIAIISDKLIIGINQNKAFYIITKRKELVERFLIEGLKKEVTLIEANTIYEEREEDILYCVVSSKDYFKIKEGVKAIDENAFFIIANTYEVIGGKKL